MADIMAVLYGAILHFDPAQPGWLDRDRVVISKGHAAAIVYASRGHRKAFRSITITSHSVSGS